MLQTYSFLFGLMETLGKKWVVPLLLFLLIYEKANFSMIKKQLKITSRALSTKLRMLESLGLVERILIEDSRNAIYALSERGKEISRMLVGFSSNIV